MMNNVKAGTSAYVAPPVKEVVFQDTSSPSVPVGFLCLKMIKKDSEWLMLGRVLND